MSGSEPSGPGALLGQVDDTIHEYFDWYPVAKKDFRDALRSRGLWLLSLVFTVIFVSPVVVALYLGGIGPSLGDGPGTRALIENVYLNIVTIILPLVTLFVGVAAITKEKRSGSLKLLLSLPFSRRSVIIGKVIGRCAVVAVPFGIASSITAIFLIVSRISFDGVMYALFMFFSLVFALVMVAIAVSISGAVKTTLRSVLVNAALYFNITFAWNLVANELGQLLANDLGVSRSVRWHTVLLIKLASPAQAYKTLVNGMLARFSQPVQPDLQDFAERWELAWSQLSPQQYARYNLFNVDGGFLSPGLPTGDKQTLCQNVLGGAYRNATLSANNQTQTVTVATESGNQTFQSAGQITANVTQEAAFCTGGSGLPFYLSDPAVVVFMLGWVGLAAAFSYYTFDQVDL